MRDYSPIDAVAEILNEVPELVFVFALDDRYLYINQAAALFLAADPFEVIGNHWSDLGYPAEVMEPLLLHVRQAAQTGEPERYRLTTSPGRGSRVLDVSLTPLRSDSDTVYAVLMLAHDITEFVG